MKDAEKEQVIKRARALVLEDPEKREQIAKNFKDAKPIVDDLVALGYPVETLSDLTQQRRPWKTALPVLLRWLPRIANPDIKAAVVRSLSVPWLGNTGTELLIEEFKKYAPILPNPTNPWSGDKLRELPDDEKKAAPFFALAWAIGNALSIVDVRGFESQIIELCRNSAYGMARQMLVLGLSRFDSAEAEDTALGLLEDESVKLHAVIALGKMKSQRALSQLENLLADKRPIIRREARKAIKNITR